MNGFTISDVLGYAEVIQAVQARKRVIYLADQDRTIEGTLRALTPADGTPAFLHGNGDPRTAWVWITTKQGFETWVKLSELVSAHAERMVGFDV